MRLNLGCGSNKIKDCVNVDMEMLKPNVVADITKGLPFKEESIEKIYIFHTIEHIPENLHHNVFSEIWRILEMGGELFISYPEFIKCAQNYINNKMGMRQFWKATLYGRQLYKTDFHVALMDTTEFCDYLTQAGFKVVKTMPEPREDYNTIVMCKKVKKNFFSKPELAKQLLESV